LLQDQYRDSDEAILLYVSAVISGDDHAAGREQDYKTSLNLLKRLAARLPERQPKAQIFRTGSLFDEEGHDLVNHYWAWAIRRYMDFLIDQNKLDEALNFLTHQTPGELRSKLMDFYSRVQSEKRSMQRTDQRIQETLQSLADANEQAQVKHLEILSVFLVVMTFVAGGLLSYMTSSSDNFHYRFGLLIEFGLMLTGGICLALTLVAKTYYQILARLFVGSALIILAMQNMSSNVTQVPQGVLIEKI